MYSRLALLLILSIGALAQNPSAAGPSNTSQEAVVFDLISNHVRYENDGTGQRVTQAVIRIQSEAAVQAYGQLVFGYSSGFESIDVDYVRVRKPDGEVVPTPNSSLQDFAPEVLRSAPMYSDYRERHVTVVGLRPGDVLEYRTTTLITTPLATGEFWYEYRFPKHIAVTQARLEIDVPRTRDLKLKSPNRKFA